VKPQYLVTTAIYEADQWRNGKEFHLSGLRDSTAAKADQEGFAVIGHEVAQYVWMVRSEEDGREVFRSLKVTYTRQVVSRKVRI
jgi:hypothetical protein